MNNPFKDDFEGVKRDFKDFFKRDGNQQVSRFSKAKRNIAILITVVYALVYFYVLLPPINLRSYDTWLFVGTILIVLIATGGKSIKSHKLLKIILFVMVILFGVLQLSGLKIFRAKDYSNIITIQESNFNEDIEQLPVDRIPTLDRESSVRVGARKMGELIDLVSQFNIDEDTYTQINYQEKPVRVTPLKYNGFIKYLTNMSDGIPGIIKIDIVTGEAELMKLENKIKISKNDYFFRDITRYARLRYPFEIFEDINFEIDDNGTPYWVIPTYKPRIGWFGAPDVNGAILVNAANGEHKKYNLDEIPNWIDRIYNSDKIIEQLNWNGSLKDGYINSKITQKNVLQTTEGYNYLALNDDIFLYTGLTSVSQDESNVGFVLVNQRTKEAKFYPVSSAEEFSAMESAQGEVQEKGYKSTFPLLLNINGQATYFLSLKDNAGLIKQYAFVNAKNYQDVAVGSTVAKALQNYNLESGNASDDDELEDIPGEGVVSAIQSVVINGYTHYYFTLENDENVYSANIMLSDKLPLMQTGSRIKFNYHKKQVNEVVYIEELE